MLHEWAVVPTETAIDKAADLIEAADGLLIGAGAGMAVDSGLPDFRGENGFWKAYPALGRAGFGFSEIANPMAFLTDPKTAWGFYGHRLQLYRAAVPHEGFSVLKQIASHLTYGAFVFTSNVDGLFQKAGFPEQRICEIHGSIHYLQCAEPCCADVWDATRLRPMIDEQNCSWVDWLPSCDHCGRLARPNILMFDDHAWIDERTEHQRTKMMAWRGFPRSLVALEIGAGVQVPTVRRFIRGQGVPVIRINPQGESKVGNNSVDIQGGALSVILHLGKIMAERGFLSQVNP